MSHLNLEARSIVWGIKRLQGYLWSTKFCTCSDHTALENIAKGDEHNARVQRWLEFLIAFDCTLGYPWNTAKAAPM